MCGIFAGISPNIIDELISGLSMLEYRGYDSAGITTISDGKLKTAKVAGKFKELRKILEQGSYAGTAGIGHVRWATHGAPTVINAHPHGTDRVSIVHNGIIENYASIKADLEQKGYHFESETDTEIVAKLLDDNLKTQSPIEAACSMFDAINGSYSLVCLFAGHDDLLIGSCNKTPLVVGIAENDNAAAQIYLSSDINAFPAHVTKVSYLKDGDRIVVQNNRLLQKLATDEEFAGDAERKTAAYSDVREDFSTALTHKLPSVVEFPEKAVEYKIYDAKYNLITREVVPNQVAVLASKGEYSCYMLKEIKEQPTILKHIADTYLDNKKFANLNIDWQSISHINIVACGSAYYAGLTGLYWLEELSGIPVSAEIASEYIYRKNAKLNSTRASSNLVIVISQSGETLDTLEALKKAKAAGSQTLAIINVEHSTIAREADHVLPIYAGPEIGVASTKAFTAQLAVIAALSIFIGKQLASALPESIENASNALKAIPVLIEEIISREERILAMAQEIKNANSILYLGRGNVYPIALEGALKLKELSYIHAEGYPGGELKHGPISLIEDKFPVICLLPPNKMGEKMLSNIQEIKARGGHIFSFASGKLAAEAQQLSKMHFELPQHDEFSAPIIFTVCLQILSYHTCNLLGNDPDQPRNLAKSVTVE